MRQDPDVASHAAGFVRSEVILESSPRSHVVVMDDGDEVVDSLNKFFRRYDADTGLALLALPAH